MLMNEISMYAEIVSTEVELVLALTINVSINFSSKHKPDLNLLGESILLKVGKSLIIAQFIV